MEDLIRLCAWCDRIYVGGRWVVADLPAGTVIHGGCPECMDMVERGWTMDQIDEHWREKGQGQGDDAR
jgi:hypothetical protein